MTEATRSRSHRHIRNAILTGIVALTFTWLGMLIAGFGQQTETGLAESSPAALTAAAQTVQLNGDSPFKAIARKITPAVVFISNTHEVTAPQGLEFFHGNPFWEKFFGESDPQPYPKRDFTSSASGIIINEEGYILTNNHVVEGAKKLMVKLSDETEFEAEVIGSDNETDLAVLHLLDFEGELPYANLGNSDLMEPGDWAIAIGNPFGLERTVTVGVISATGRSGLNIGGAGGPRLQNFLQTDASINFGNSGGPLVNIHGEVIGINTAINAAGQGIGFAIPSNIARDIYQQLRDRGEIVRGYLGIVPRALSPAIREALELNKDVKGIFVDNVEPETPADKGGLQAGDIITKWNGRAVELVPDFRFRVAAIKPGEKVKAVILRNDEKLTLAFKLGDRSEYLAQAGLETPGSPSDNIFGIQVRELTESDLKSSDWRLEAGVVITGFSADSEASSELQAGDIIITIGKETVQNVSSFNDIMDNLPENKAAIMFRIFRNGRFTFVTIKL